MEIILSHVNTDFDALASMIAAKKLYPDAQLVISDKQDNRVKRFLNIYRDTFDFKRDVDIDWAKVSKMILVDVAILRRAGRISDEFDEENCEIIVYDHHPEHENDVAYTSGIVEPVGAAVTLLLEEIKERGISITEFEATLFGLGIYTDTGNFTYKNTTPRDLQMGSYLVESGMDLEMVRGFSEESLKPEQQELLDHLLQEATIHEVDGLEIAVSTYVLDNFQGGLAILTNKLREVKGADAALAIVKMKNHVHIVGRANSNRITLLPLLEKFGGGGHKHAGSAMVKRGDYDAIVHEIENHLALMLKPAITAEKMMTSPVKTLTPETTIEEAGRRMYRYGHSGYPIVEDDKLVGLITRRDLDKANHHGLGHAPVKAYMTTNMITIDKGTTLEAIQDLVIEHNIGRLPVIEDEKIIGIVTRTNIIEMLHGGIGLDNEDEVKTLKTNLQEEMEEQLSEEVFTLLKEVSETAQRMDCSIYLIGGIVRDMLLERPNDDIDIVAEGDGIQLTKELQKDYGGEVLEHDSFGTATWNHPSGVEIDITSSRLEYYDRPASLPDVEKSTLEEDLERRDFTINAMAIRLDYDRFGELIDPFGGQEHLYEKKIKTLHNISFVEDPTRIFRAIRFENRFDFRMEEQTEKLALNSIDKVRELTANRIVEEMKRLFKEGEPAKVIQRLFELNFWQQFGVSTEQKEKSCAQVKELQILYQTLNGEAVLTPSWFSYFIIPFHVQGALETAKVFALTKEEMKYMNEIAHIDGAGELEGIEKSGDVHSFLKDISPDAIVFLCAAESIENKSKLIEYVQKRNRLPKYFTGKDLMSLGQKPGPHFSKFFTDLEKKQLNGEIQSKEEAEKWLASYFAE